MGLGVRAGVAWGLPVRTDHCAHVLLCAGLLELAEGHAGLQEDPSGILGKRPYFPFYRHS